MSGEGMGDPASAIDVNEARGKETGYARLNRELTAFRAEFESLAEMAVEDGNPPGWIQRGRKLIEEATDALADGDYEHGWSSLKTAERLKYYGIEQVGGVDALEGEGRELLVEARNAPLSWRSEAIDKRIAKADGTLRDDLTWSDLRAARELLDEGYHRMHLKRQHLQSQFGELWKLGVLTVAVFLGVSGLSVVWVDFPSPLHDFANPGSANSTWFVIYVVLTGILGASIFGLRSLRKQPVSGSTPQYLTGRQTALARIVTGAGSALAIFFFLRSELLTIGVGTTPDSGPFLLAFAFAAGYSQRLVHTTIETVASVSDTETPENDES